MADLERERNVNSPDAAGVGPYARDASKLSRLSKLDDWGIAENEPDIRGWEVRTVSGRELGEVKDLLVDEEAGEVVMLDVDVHGTDRHALVPIRVVALDRGSRVVRMDSADLQTPASEADREVPVPALMEPAEVERRAEATSGDTAERDRLRERKREARYGDRHEVVVQRRPVVVEETVVRRRTLSEEESKPDDRM